VKSFRLFICLTLIIRCLALGINALNTEKETLINPTSLMLRLQTMNIQTVILVMKAATWVPLLEVQVNLGGEGGVLRTGPNLKVSDILGQVL
jgi:hypothetical protein